MPEKSIGIPVFRTLSLRDGKGIAPAKETGLLFSTIGVRLQTITVS